MENTFKLLSNRIINLYCGESSESATSIADDIQTDFMTNALSKEQYDVLMNRLEHLLCIELQ